MIIAVQRGRVWWSRASTRMTLAFAARGTVAMLVPFVVLFSLGLQLGSVLAALGGMFAVLSDTGGGYHRRLAAMTLETLASAISLFVGALVAPWPWLLPILLAVVAFAGGMARSFGGSGASAGLFMCIVFLVGSLTPVSAPDPFAFAGYYVLGSLWVISTHLTVWRLRPYRVLLQEIAACYDACARLVTALELAAAGADSALARRRIKILHQGAREAIRNAETTLESLRVGVGQSSPVFDHAQLLIAAVSREVIAATGLRRMQWPAPGTEAARSWRVFFAGWKKALVGISRVLLTGRGNVSTRAMHVAFEALEQQGQIGRTQAAPLRLAFLHMNTVSDAGARLSSSKLGWRDALPRPRTRALGRVRDTLVGHLTFESVIFRHALRIALASGFGLWLSDVIGVAHHLWLPMTTIIVLRPEFGATWRRMGHRIAGTLTGVLIAGALHFLVHDSVVEIVIIACCAFLAFYFIRRIYGIGVIFLTPMILLLLGVLLPQESGMLIIARGVDTILGGLLALLAAYVLWPKWQRDTFRGECAEALRQMRAHLASIFNQPGDDRPSRLELMNVRHAAERASDSADASLELLLAEPAKGPGQKRAALNFMTYIRRLADNATHFSVALSGASLAADQQAQANAVLRRLDRIADTLDGAANSIQLTDITPKLHEVPASTGPLAVWFERFAADSAELAIAVRRLVRH